MVMLVAYVLFVLFLSALYWILVFLHYIGIPEIAQTR